MNTLWYSNRPRQYYIQYKSCPLISSRSLNWGADLIAGFVVSHLDFRHKDHTGPTSRRYIYSRARVKSSILCREGCAADVCVCVCVCVSACTCACVQMHVHGHARMYAHAFVSMMSLWEVDELVGWWWCGHTRLLKWSTDSSSCQTVYMWTDSRVRIAKLPHRIGMFCYPHCQSRLVIPLAEIRLIIWAHAVNLIHNYLLFIDENTHLTFVCNHNTTHALAFYFRKSKDIFIRLWLIHTVQWTDQSKKT